MKRYETDVRRIVRRWGGYRERAVLAAPHTIERGETWNAEHKVLYVLPLEAEPDGYRAGFAVDLVTGSICG